MGALDQGEYLARDLLFQAFLGHGQVVVGLKVEPELRGGAKGARQAQSGIGGDAALALDDGVDAIRRDAQGARQGILADAQRLEELFQQDLAGVNGRNVTGHVTPLVIVHDFDVVGVTLLPDEAQAIAVVDADAVLSFTVTVQFLQAVARWDAQIIQADGGVQDEQFAQGRALQIGG